MYIPIHPPSRIGTHQHFPFVAATTPEENTTSSGDPETDASGYIWAYATLMDATSATDAPAYALAGPRAANAFPIDEGSGTAGTRQGVCAVVWPNLAVTSPGTYRIRVELYWVPHEEGPEGQVLVDTVYSNSISVVAEPQRPMYGAKESRFIQYLQDHGFNLDM